MKPKVYFLDIETSPLVTYNWGLFEQNIGLNQIQDDWFIMSFAAKLLGADQKIVYADQRSIKNKSNDKKLLLKLKDVLDDADVIITQNGKRFDVKKINARFVMNGIKKPSGYKHIDILQETRKQFGFTSHKLEYMTKKLCKKYKKSGHSKFPGMSLWVQCLAGNKEAWEEMEKYNKYDILSLEELYNVIIGWITSVNYNLYDDEPVNTCKCGNNKFNKNGYFYTESGKFQRYKCTKCGSETRDKTNLFSKEKRQSLRPYSK